LCGLMPLLFTFGSEKSGLLSNCNIRGTKDTQLAVLAVRIRALLERRPDRRELEVVRDAGRRADRHREAAHRRPRLRDQRPEALQADREEREPGGELSASEHRRRFYLHWRLPALQSTGLVQSCACTLRSAAIGGTWRGSGM